MTKCEDPTHQLGPSKSDLELIHHGEARVKRDMDIPKHWYEVTVINEPLLEGNLRIRASSKEEAEEIFRECLQRACVITELEPIASLIKRSSIGAALDDIKERGIDEHLRNPED